MEKTKKSDLNIYQKIVAVMGEIDCIQKSDKKVNGQYTFVSHDQVTAAIHPVLVKFGIVIIPTVETCIQVGNRTEVTLNVSFVNADVPADRFSLVSVGYGIDSSDKGPGKAVSYAYKYALLKAFCLETSDDPDKDVKSKHIIPLPEKVYMNDNQVKIIMDLIKGDVDLLDRILTVYNVDALCELEGNLFHTIMGKLNKTVATNEHS